MAKMHIHHFQQGACISAIINSDAVLGKAPLLDSAEVIAAFLRCTGSIKHR